MREWEPAKRGLFHYITETSFYDSVWGNNGMDGESNQGNSSLIAPYLYFLSL